MVAVPGSDRIGYTNSFSNALASIKLGVSTPAVIQPYIASSNSRASVSLPCFYDNSSNSALASIKSGVPNPSVNQPYIPANNSRASLFLPCFCYNRAKLIVVRSSQDLALCLLATSKDW